MNSNIYAVLGPPGTGKTTYLSKQVKKATEKHQPDQILIASFTKTAATTIAQRTNLPKGQVNTLHAFAYRQLEAPQIIETQEHAEHWNQTHPQPDRQITPQKDTTQDADDPTQTTPNQGDALLNQVNTLRAKMTPIEQWPPQAATFYHEWQEHKKQNQLLDFTDLIHTCIEQDIPPPHGTKIAFFDEVQDFTALEATLARQWAKHLDMAIFAGDDDQTIYTFKGADPKALTQNVPQENRRVLKQSYRIPKAVHTLATHWIQQIPDREPKEYQPTNHQGEISVHPHLTLKQPHQIPEILNQMDGTTMLLTTSSYQLKNIIKTLKHHGIPYHNPYRQKRTDWNPLTPQTGTPTSQRVYSYAQPAQQNDIWTYKQLAEWTHLINANTTLQPGAKKQIEQAAEYYDASIAKPDIEWLLTIFQPETLEHALTGNLDWLSQHLKTTTTAKYHLQIAQQHGPQALRQQPKVTIGTIHSVKGGEADNVIVFPNLSPNGYRSYLKPQEKANTIRLFYVAMTRAKKRLLIAGQAGPSVNLTTHIGHG